MSVSLATKSWQPSPAQAATELLRRRRARRDLLDFTIYTFPQYKPDPFHALLANTLQQVVDGEIDRLMVFAPPQTGKSEMASVRLPAFWLGKRPDDPVIVASYGADLAVSKSRQVRDLIESHEYRALFGDLRPGPEMAVTTRDDSRAVHHWQLAAPYRGGMKAVGVGGPVTGHGALLGLIDDPFENWEQAQSSTVRDKIWDWYRGTFRTRIWEGGAIVLVMTRWHEDDLAGRLLKEQPGEWHVLRLPALAETQEVRDDNNRRMGLPEGEPDPLGREPEEALAPSRYSAQELQRIQRDVGPVVWAAEYQGSPRAAEGNRFKRSWFQILPALPTGCNLVRYWDKAGTDDAGAYTCGLLMGRAPDKRYIVVDVVRGQWSAGQREAIIKQTAQLDRQAYGHVEIWIEQEPGSGGKESAENTIRNLDGFSVYKDRVTGDKEIRAEPFAAQAEVGNVFLLEGAWNRVYLDEITVFPNGKFKDQVDASSGAFNKLARPRGWSEGAAG